MVTVSYTHLDVYKRQVLVSASDSSSNIATKEVLVEVVDDKAPEFTVVGVDKGYVVPVSYTHLDVYKRQGWHTECVVMINDIFEDGKIDIHGGGQDLKFPHHENEIAQSMACLLYTSILVLILLGY